MGLFSIRRKVMKRRLYGVLDPKKLDYLFSILLALLAASALWVGIWIAATGSHESAKLAFELFGNALKFDLSSANYWVILLQSVIIYGGLATALVMLLLALFKKKFRATLGGFAVAFAALAIALETGFVAVYANALESEVIGVFAVVLAILVMVTFVYVYKMASYTCLLVVFNKFYNEEFELAKRAMLKDKEKKVSSISKSQIIFEPVYEEQKEAPKPEKSPEPAKDKKKKAEPKVQKVEQIDEEIDNSPFGIKANHYTFEQKLKMAKPVARKYFKEIKAYYEELGFKSALTNSGETFSFKNTKFALITTAGKSGLKIYLKLSPANYEDSTLPFKDVSDKKKYEKTPLLFVVKSDLAVRRAKALMDDIKKELENEQK